MSQPAPDPVEDAPRGPYCKLCRDYGCPKPHTGRPTSHPDQPLDLDAIQARTSAARPGPWTVHDDLAGDGYPGHLWTVQNPDTDGPGENHIVISIGDRSDAEFVAHARQDVPALVAEVERLTAENQQLAEQAANLANPAV